MSIELKDFLAAKPTDTTPDPALKLIGIDPSSGDFVRVEPLDMLDPQIQAITNYVHLSSYASWTSAIAAIGSTPTILKIDETPTISSGGDLPKTLFLDYSGGYGLNIASGQVITGTMPMNAPMSQIWTGAGQYRIKATAGANVFYGVWCLPDGTVSTQVITAAMSEMMRYWLFLNNGGRLILPMGHYTIDHDWVAQRGFTEGSGNDSNGNGTILERIAGAGSDQPAFFRVLPGARQVAFKNMVLETALADCAQITARGAGGSGSPVDQTVDGILMSNITVDGGSEGFRIHDTTVYKNWQCHNVYIDNLCNFLGQTTACLRTNTVNGGFHCDTGNVTPAKNGTAVGWLNEGCAKVTMALHGAGQVAEALPGNPPAAVKFTFTSSDVNTTTNAITAAAGDDLQDNDSLYFTTTGTLPAPLTLATKYWWNATNNTLHTNPEESEAGTNPVDLTTGGSGTHTCWSTRPNPDATPDQPFALIKIAGPYSEGITLTGNQRDEGMPWLLYVDPSTPDNDAADISFVNVLTQGQVFLGSDVTINLFGGQFPADSFKDDVGVAAKVRNYGAKAYTYGIGGPKNNYGGYATPSPHGLDDFCGNSVFLNDHNLHDADMHARNNNDIPIWGVRVRKAGGAIRNITQKIKRLGSGLLAGWWKWDNSYEGLTDSQVGNWWDGGIAHGGRFLNSRGDTATASGGAITVNCQLGVYHQATPVENATIEFSNANTGFNHPICLRIKTSGTTSYDLTPGTNVVMRGTFSTGTTSGALFSIWFDYNKAEGKWIESGRATIENAQDDGNNLQLDNDALLTSAYHGGSIGFHQDTTQKAIRITPDSPGALTKGYVKVMNVTNGSNEDFKMQLVPETDGDAIIDVYQADLSLQLSGSTALKIDETITAGNTRLLLYDVDNGTLERVSVGAADSGGTGFKVLRIPN